MLVQCTRTTCGRAVVRLPNQIRRAKHTFCSPECRWTYYSEQKLARAWAAVDRNGPLPPYHPEYGPCWIFPYKPGPYGYATSSRPGTRGHAQAHRVALEAKMGPLPKVLFACHTCDVRNCVRNDEEGIYEVGGILRVRWGHLFAGTRADNIADMIAKGKNGNARVTEAMVLDIRSRYAAGEITLQQLADEYGTGKSTTHRIVHRLTWRHVV